MESSTPVFAMSNKEIAVTSSKKESSVADTYNKTYSQSQPDESEVPVKGSKVLYRCIRSNRAPSSCNMAHVPYHHKTAPFAFMRLVPCQVCKRKWVPETILSTIEPPPSLEIRGQGQFLEARICRQRKSGTGEIDAGKISEVLPFVEYDLQRQLMFKLKILGMNAAFGISNTIQIGKNVVVAVSTCTAVYLEALPPPPSLVVSKISKEPYLDEIEAIANANKESLDLAYNAKQRAIALLREVNEGKVALKHVGSSNRKMKPSPRLSSAMASISEHDDQMTEDDNPKYTDPGSSGSFSGVNTSFDDKVGLVTSTSADENYSEAEYDSDTESSSSSSSSSTDSDSSEEDGEESSLESPGGSSSSETSSDTDGDEEDENASKKGNPRRMTSGNNSVDTEHQEVTSRARSLSQNSSDIALVSSGQQQIMKPKRSKPAPRKTRMKFRTIFTDDLPPFVLEIDDETDKDIAAVVSDWNAPDRFDWTNLSVKPIKLYSYIHVNVHLLNICCHL